jgi:hypothetical protein
MGGVRKQEERKLRGREEIKRKRGEGRSQAKEKERRKEG